MNRLLLLLDRTAVLFLGVAAGVAIGYAFGSGGSRKQAVELAPQALPLSQAPPAIAPPPPSVLAAAPAAPDVVATIEPAPIVAPPPRDAMIDAVHAGRTIRVGVFGDSFGDGVWSALYRLLPAKDGYRVAKYSQQSTGFTRYRRLNLEEHDEAQIGADPLDVAVISFGANDAQGVCDGGKCGALMGAYWQKVIGARVEAYVAMLRRHGAAVYWVGLPAMRDPAFDGDATAMDAFYRALMERLDVPYVEIRPLTVDADGRYRAYYADADGSQKLLRAGDGVHMSMNGYLRVTKALAGQIRASVAAARAADPPPQAEREAMIALAAAAALTLGSGCVEALCNGAALAPYFAKLRAGAHAGPPVHILQIGDSHTAGDAITGAWRDILQARYGSGGRGVMPPGRPYDGYTTRGVQVTMSPGWKINSDFGAAWASPSPPLGLSAFSLTSQVDGATMALTADGGEAFTRLTMCAVEQPGGGSLVLRAGGATDTFDLGSVSARPECRTLRSDSPVTSADITATGAVTITSWATFGDSGGVALSNLGVVGSQLVHFARTDDAVLGEELRSYRPDLIVVAFGTNEGFAPRFSGFEYEIILRTQLGRLRRLAGNVPILLLGAPDALSRRAEMRGNAPGDPAANCGERPVIAAPAAAAPETGFAGVVARLRESIGLAPAEPAPAPAPAAAPTPAPPPARSGLFPPPALKAVRDVQRRVAASLNIAFWDWEARQGGRCAALAWVRATPPLMRGDYVHYTSAGGRELAQRLEADLEQAAGR